MISDFGKAIKHRLVDMEKNQAWLIEEVKADTGLYFDSSYMTKILNGTIHTPRIVDSICKVLDIRK